MSRVTRSSVNLSGDITEYLIENSSMGPGGGANPEDIQSLLAMMARTLEAVTNQTKSTSNPKEPAAQNLHIKIENCPIKRSTSSLDAWINEVTLWNDSTVAEDDAVRAKKYLKFIDSVRKSEDCSDLNNLVEVEFVENQDFDKKAENVITDIVSTVAAQP